MQLINNPLFTIQGFALSSKLDISAKALEILVEIVPNPTQHPALALIQVNTLYKTGLLTQPKCPPPLSRDTCRTTPVTLFSVPSQTIAATTLTSFRKHGLLQSKDRPWRGGIGGKACL